MNYNLILSSLILLLVLFGTSLEISSSCVPCDLPTPILKTDLSILAHPVQYTRYLGNASLSKDIVPFYWWIRYENIVFMCYRYVFLLLISFIKIYRSIFNKHLHTIIYLWSHPVILKKKSLSENYSWFWFNHKYIYPGFAFFSLMIIFSKT